MIFFVASSKNVVVEALESTTEANTVVGSLSVVSIPISNSRLTTGPTSWVIRTMVGEMWVNL